MKQHELAQACKISPSYIGLIETGSRRIEPPLLEEICRALELRPSEIDALISRGEADSTAIKPDVRVRTILQKACKEMRASSSTFYVRDPFWPGDFRLVAMPGVQMQEPMHGFVGLEGTQRVLKMGDCEFCTDTLATTDRRDTQVKLPTTIPADRRILFSDFVEREGVRASARLLIKSGDTVEGVLFVNFPEKTDFTAALQQQLTELRDSLRVEIPGVTRMFQIEDAPILRRALNVIQPIQDWTARISYRQENLKECQQLLKKYLESVLENLMAFASLDTAAGFGAIHLFRDGYEGLFLEAYRGDIERGCPTVQSVERGEGIISWVAIKEGALLINDLQTSRFEAIHVRFRKGISSALGVPITAGQKVIGAIVLEAETPGHFQSQHVRALWYAAGSVGLAASLYRQAAQAAKRVDMRTELLRCLYMAINAEDGRDKAFTRLAEIASEAFDAHLCDLWNFDPSQKEPFCLWGANREVHGPGPRRNGWSEYVCRTGCEVWLSDIRRSGSLDASFWNSQLSTWERTPPRTGTPESVNARVLELAVGSELGIPIVCEQACVGILWLKFNNVNRSRPSQEETLLAKSFAESVGQVWKSLPHELRVDGSSPRHETSATSPIDDQRTELLQDAPNRTIQSRARAAGTGM
jgi:GAF domain-containing protein/transcriptional regulator with XRE-family HTH domain